MVREPILLLLFFTLIVSQQISANAVPKLDLPSKISGSAVVAIGRVISVYPVTIGRSPEHYALVHVVSSIRGATRPTLKVLYDGPIAEFNPLCCEIGSEYLFFLKTVPGQGELLESTNGPYGVYEILGGFISHWTEDEGKTALEKAVQDIRSTAEHTQPTQPRSH